MTDTSMARERSRFVTGARWALVALAVLFTFGAFGQFFLVGVSYFDNPVRWKDHANFGSILGLLTYVIWIPAVLGRTGTRVVLGSVLLLVLFMAQHASIAVDSPMVNALHPLNGAVMLVLAFWIAQRTLAVIGKRDANASRIERIVKV